MSTKRGHAEIAPLQLYRAADRRSTGELIERAELSAHDISTDRAERDRSRATQLASVRPPVEALPIPVHLTSFIGREHEVAEVRRLLGVTRLLTLTGTGGIGKTRLALEAARTSSDLAFVDLAPHSDDRLLTTLVAAALGIQEQPRVSALHLLTTTLASRSVLLILDNCEHLVSACSELADHLLRACPRLRILATSRQPLALAGEQLWPVPPLSVGGSADSPPAGEAERLFAERARLVQHNFALDAGNATRVTEVCRRLDGIPLAIELAAARVRVLGLEGIEARLDDHLRLLSTESRGVVARQRTLRAAIEWSYDLLSEPEKAFFRRLSVFVGGWTVTAIESIWDSADPVRSDDVLDLLTHLVDKSLVQVEPNSDGCVRYGLLETIREYAQERLRASGEMAAVRQRHAVYFLRFAQEVEPKLWGPAPEVWIKRLEQELDNARAALDWLIESPAVPDALEMGGALGRFWLIAGRYKEGQLWITRLLEMTCAEDPTAVRAKLLRANVSLWLFQGDAAAAQPLAEAALALTRRQGSEIDIARSLLVLANTVQDRGDFAAARRFLEEAVALSRRAGVTVELVDALHYLTGDAFAVGDFARARAIAGDCLDSAREAGYARGIARAEWVLGSIACLQHDLSAARLHLEASIASSRELNAWWETVQGSVWLAHVAAEEGDYAGSASLLMQTRELGQQLGDPEILCLFLEGAVHLAAVADQPRQALRLAAAAEAYRESTGSVLFPVMRSLIDEWLAPGRKALGRQQTKSLLAAGREFSLEQALAEASTWDCVPGNPARSSGPLTRRELEVAALIARGRNNREIAQELVIAASTAERHVANILGRLNLRSRTEIAAWMVEQSSHSPRSGTHG